MSLSQTNFKQRQPRNFAEKTYYRVHADLEVSVLARVLELFTLRSLIPDQLKCERDDAALHIFIKLPAMPHHEAEHLARRMRNILPVVSVVWSSL